MCIRDSLTGNQEVKAICPRCFGNGFIRIQGVQYDCPQCDSQGWVMLPAHQSRINVDRERIDTQEDIAELRDDTARARLEQQARFKLMEQANKQQ